VAKVAAARKLAVRLFWMLRTTTDSPPMGAPHIPLSDVWDLTTNARPRNPTRDLTSCVGIASTPLTELNGSGALQAEYIYFGGKRVAMRKLNLTAYYYFADQIGSANIVTNATASSTVQDIEFHPYGEEKVYTDTLGQE
jgi:hypothetical protein